MFGKFLKGLIPPGAPEKGAKLQERREHSRVPCALDIDCKQDKVEFRAVAVEISPGGLRVTAAQCAPVDSELLLSFRPRGVPEGRQRIRAKIIWSTPREGGFEIGLKFTDTRDNMDHSWAYLQMRKLGFDPLRTFRRQARRFACQVPAQAFDANAVLLGQATILNIGQGGALLRLGGLVPPGKGSRIELSFGELKLFARVLGCRTGEGGYFVNLRFLNHPDSQEFKQLNAFLQKL